MKYWGITKFRSTWNRFSYFWVIFLERSNDYGFQLIFFRTEQKDLGGGGGGHAVFHPPLSMYQVLEGHRSRPTYLILLERIAAIASSVVGRSVCLSVCLSVCVCWSRSWALRKRLNRSWCRLGFCLGWAQWTMY